MVRREFSVDLIENSEGFLHPSLIRLLGLAHLVEVPECLGKKSPHHY